jgi:hypothetical protein
MKRPGKGQLWKAIRSMCTSCIGSVYQIEGCTGSGCPLYDFRLGPDNPMYEKNAKRASAAKRQDNFGRKKV